VVDASPPQHADGKAPWCFREINREEAQVGTRRRFAHSQSTGAISWMHDLAQTFANDVREHANELLSHNYAISISGEPLSRHWRAVPQHCDSIVDRQAG
jgi:hypothetical protein